METRNNRTTVIADTSALVSMAVMTDSNHTRAVTGAHELIRSASILVIAAEVLAETINLLDKKFGRDHAVTTGRKLIGDDAFLVVDSGPQIRSRALELFEAAPGGTSYIDCLVVATAEHYNTHLIFGFDEYFSKQRYSFPGESTRRAA